MIWLLLAVAVVVAFLVGVAVGTYLYASRLPEILAGLDPEAMHRLAQKTRAHRVLNDQPA